VSLEAALLSDAEIVDACWVSVDAGAESVKTSTGFNFRLAPLAGGVI
jgi:deoxyribose-phosphate aldolase